MNYGLRSSIGLAERQTAQCRGPSKPVALVGHSYQGMPCYKGLKSVYAGSNPAAVHHARPCYCREIDPHAPI